MTMLRLGLIRDFRAENWPSMDLCADQLLTYLPTVSDVLPTDLETPFRRRFQRLPFLGRKNSAFNADRVINRHFVLQRFLKQRSADFDFFHIVDHSYAHVAASLPPGRCGVYCHDLDAFRSILHPTQDPRPRWFRHLARRTLRGLQAAAVVFHSTREVGRQLIGTGLIQAEKLVYAPYGVASEFTANEVPSITLPQPGIPTGPFLLLVGSHAPRKRLDVLLDVFAGVRERIPNLKLIQVGPPWN